MEREYEISLWEDKDLYNEVKIATIGSDTMTAQSRALEPMMKSNVNGTHTFTFKIFYKYIDTYTGEEVMNPFLALLVNERKVKVKWKGEWFDLVIKNCQESSDGHTITYTCSDLYMTELGKNGFELNFSKEAKNNQGTITQLGKKVLEGTDWTLKENNEILNQTKEEPLYKATTTAAISATNLTTGETITIAADTVVYVFYSSKEENEYPIQFLYSEDGYSTEENQMLILDKDINYSIEGDFGDLFKNSSLSNQYRGKKLISHYETEYDPVLDKIVGVYTDTTDNKEVYGYVDYDYDAPPIVTNLIAEPKDFTTMAGWHSSNTLTTKLYPEVTTNTTVTGYEGKSYLVAKISNSTPLVNKGLKSCTSYLPDGFSKGQKLYCRIKAYSTLGSSLLSNLKVSIKRRNDNFDLGSPATVYFDEVTLNISKDGYYTGTLTCSTALDPAYVSMYTGIFITNGSAAESTIYLEEFQLFELIKDSEGNICYPDSIVTDQVIKPRYHYYSKTNIDDESYTPVYDAFEDNTNRFKKKKSDNPYEKIRTIEAKQSNRFNILQQLAETFQCWVRFHIDHEENGSIKIIDGVPQKFVEFIENVGEQLYYGFTYGIDLNNIQRTIISDQITSKIIVLPNQNELAPHGTCNISTSEENYPGVNFLLDFDYYCNHGLLNAGQVNKDLYQSPDSTGLGYFVKLHQLSEKYKKLTEDENIYKAQAMTLDSYYKTYIELQNATEVEKNSTLSELYSITRTSNIAGINSYISKYGNTAADISTKLATYKELEKRFDTYNDIITSVETQLKSVNSKLDAINAETTGDTSYYGINKQTDELNAAFYKKYSRFIQEGTWNSQEYIDPNLYYLDALDVAYTSSRPQVQYNISVTRVSDLEDFKLRKFKVGDVSYIEDPEFFGYTRADETNLKTPYREEVLISETQEYFESPDKDTITVQNYKTQFEDLFQRITATTQSLQYNQGNYARAANIVDDSGAIKPAILQNSLILARNIVKDSQNESIIEDNTGITLTDLRDLSKKVKIASGGILFSNDGGLTWSTLLSAGGISTNYLTSGQINTNKIIIQDGKATTFRWDSKGINAYYFLEDTNGEINPDFDKSIRFDRFGIYGIDDESYSDENYNTEEKIWNKAKFGMTWSGFFMKNKDASGSIEISNEKDIQIIKTKKNDDDSTTDITRLKIGRIKENSDGSKIYGIAIYDDDGKTVLETDDKGSLWLRNQLSIGKSSDDFDVSIGNISSGEKYSQYKFKKSKIYNENTIYYTKETVESTETQGSIYKYDSNNNIYILVPLSEIESEITYYSFDLVETSSAADIGNYYERVITHQIINANDNFKVYSDGTLEANDGIFRGIVNATSGSFNGSLSSKDASIGCLKVNGNSVLIDTTPYLGTTEGDIFSVVGPDGDLLKVDSNGILNIQNAKISGELQGATGSFSGTLSAPVGNLGGFIISNNAIVSEKTDKQEEQEDGTFKEVGVPLIQLKGSTGDAFFKNITLGVGATIEKYIELSKDKAYIYNPSYYDGKILEVKEKNEDGSFSSHISINTNGTMKLGSLEFSGVDGIIKSANYSSGNYGWILDPKTAEFNNINVSGTISASYFKYGTIQSVGGILMLKPSAKIISAEPTTDGIKITLDHYEGFNIGDHCYISKFNAGDIESDNNYTKQFEVISVASNDITIKYLDDDTIEPQNLINDTITVIYNKKTVDGTVNITNNVVLTLNGSSVDSNFGKKESLTLMEIQENSNSLKFTPKLILGKLPSLIDFSSAAGTYGLYADNVFLKGSMLSVDSNKKTYSGINTNNIAQETKFDNNGKIIMWAGSMSEDGSDAPFRVDSNGNVYASGGIFEGSLISKAEIKAANIYGVNIYGWEDQKLGYTGGLNIYDTGKGNGIRFIHEYEENGEAKKDISLEINNLGFYTQKASNENSIKFIDVEDGIKFFGNELSVANLKIIDDKIQYNTKDKIIFTENNCRFKYNKDSTESLILDDQKIYLKVEDTYISENLSMGNGNAKIEYKKVANGYDLYVS